MKDKLLRASKWMLRNTLLAAGTLLALLLFFEFAYRYSWFEFYGTEIASLNAKTKNKKCATTVLILGDSFSASENNYISILNDSISDIRFINAGVPGFGIQEIRTIAERRIIEFQPTQVVIQLYVGNDLLDIGKPVNWSEISFARNCYWSFSNTFCFSRYINYKLGQYKAGTKLATESAQTKNNSEFSPEQFSAREKLLITADPNYLDNSINLYGNYAEKFRKFTENLDDVVALCKERKLPLHILIIPSNCQVNEYYRNNLIAIGAHFTSEALGDTLYPFYTELANKADEEQVNILNPLSHFRKADSAGHRLYYSNDIHLNATGQLELTRFLLHHSTFVDAK